MPNILKFIAGYLDSASRRVPDHALRQELADCATSDPPKLMSVQRLIPEIHETCGWRSAAVITETVGGCRSLAWRAVRATCCSVIEITDRAKTVAKTVSKLPDPLGKIRGTASDMVALFTLIAEHIPEAGWRHIRARSVDLSNIASHNPAYLGNMLIQTTELDDRAGELYAIADEIVAQVLEIDRLTLALSS